MLISVEAPGTFAARVESVDDFSVGCPPTCEDALEFGGNPLVPGVAEVETSPLDHRIGRKSGGGQPRPAPGNGWSSGTLIANWTSMFALAHATGAITPHILSKLEQFNIFTNSKITGDFLLQSPVKSCVKP